MPYSGLSSRAIIGDFYQRLEAMTNAGWLGATSMYFLSDQPSETYQWLGMSPAMREWIGGRHAKGLRENGITIENKHFEATIKIPVKWIRRDKTGQIDVRVNELVERTATHWQSLLSTLIVGGESTVCYDGQFFFDTDHSEGDSGAQSNDIAVDISEVPAAVHGTTTAPSPEEVRAMILKSAEAILGFKDDQGEPVNEMVRDFHVMVPMPYWSAAAAAVGSPFLGGGDTNVMANLDGYNFAVSANPRLNWTTKLAVFAADSTTKAFIRQEETEVDLKVQAEGSQLEYQEDMWSFGVDTWRNVGYGDWRKACLATAT